MDCESRSVDHLVASLGQIVQVGLTTNSPISPNSHNIPIFLSYIVIENWGSIKDIGESVSLPPILFEFEDIMESSPTMSALSDLDEYGRAHYFHGETRRALSKIKDLLESTKTPKEISEGLVAMGFILDEAPCQELLALYYARVRNRKQANLVAFYRAFCKVRANTVKKQREHMKTALREFYRRRANEGMDEYMLLYKLESGEAKLPIKDDAFLLDTYVASARLPKTPAMAPKKAVASEVAEK